MRKSAFYMKVTSVLPSLLILFALNSCISMEARSSGAYDGSDILRAVKSGKISVNDKEKPHRVKLYEAASWRSGDREYAYLTYRHFIGAGGFVNFVLEDGRYILAEEVTFSKKGEERVILFVDSKAYRRFKSVVDTTSPRTRDEWR